MSYELVQQRAGALWRTRKQSALVKRSLHSRSRKACHDVGVGPYDCHDEENVELNH